MGKNRVLYQIKSLEKVILRSLFCEANVCIKELPTLTPTQMQIMEYILKNQNKCIYQKNLEEVLNLRRATVSGVLQTMEKNGLLRRVKDDEDARTNRIILNEHTKEIFSQKEKKINDIEQKIIKDISKDDLEVFTNVINKMKENLKNNN